MVYCQLPPKSAFPHRIIYKEKIGEDDYQNPEYAPDKAIEFVWFNLSTILSRRGINSSEKAPNASVTMLYQYTGKLPEFRVDSTIIFENKEYNILKSKPLILNGERTGWRLEVV